jgi:hypothetical protein
VTWNRVRLSLPCEGVTRCIGPPDGPLDRTVQQAPGFWAQKSSNCWASDPAGGAVSLPAVSVLVSGVVEPPVSVSPVVVPVSVPVLPDVLESLLDDELSDELLSELLLSELLLDLSFADAAVSGAWLDSGIATSAGGPGTCGAAVSLPPQPAATRARRPAARIATRREAPILLTPP